MIKIKIFLGAYVNYINAQNINCKAIAKHLDKERFEILSLTNYFGKEDTPDVKTFYCFKPFRISRHIGFLWGVLNCDIAYFPKHVDTPIWVLKLARLFKKPVFTTIEGNVTDISLPNLIDLFGSEKKIKNHFALINKIFPITTFLQVNASSLIPVQESVLPLGVDINQFSVSKRLKLESIVFVGSLIKRKQLQEFIHLACTYPHLDFNLIGDGEEKESLKKKSPKNIIFHGLLSHSEIGKIFNSSDLMFLPSRSEGFPKVILEAASAGIPSILYDSYGASDWIQHYKDGFIVNDISEVKVVINTLIERPYILQKTSSNAVKFAEKFNWKLVIKSWEKEIEDLYYGR
tara:strand:+ start:11150 stop:12187 length:1038 start_codon:yes stop_codon:yes gene_type:complete